MYIVLGPVHTTSDKFENDVFTLKKEQKFSFHTETPSLQKFRFQSFSVDNLSGLVWMVRSTVRIKLRFLMYLA